MTLEEKKIIYSDLCCRLPYNVKILRHWVAPMTESEGECVARFNSSDVEILSSSIQLDGDDGYVICDDGSYRKVRKYSCKPYLRPMEDMTEEECDMVETILGDENIFDFMRNGDIVLKEGKFTQEMLSRLYDYLNSIHVDYRGLINKGLALEAPNNMYTEIEI